MQVETVTGHHSCLERAYFTDFCVSRAAAAELLLDARRVGDIVYTISETLDMWSTGDSRQPGQLLRSPQDADAYGMCSITELATGTVAAGCHDGTVKTCNFLPCDGSPCSTWHADIR